MQARLQWVVAAAVALGAAQAGAQVVKTQMRQASDDQASCTKTVKDYVDTLRFVRQVSGQTIAGRVEQTYVPEADVLQVSGQQGPCAAVALLRTKGLVR
ncbi:MAG: hypothetical protein ACAH21_02565 [Ramlibacter sp.]|nr:hypothetical protein [Ramlibacter sp.]